MPSFTPNFALPYPNGTDAPCDFAQQWCDFSDAFQTQLDGFQAIIDRTIPVIPIARLELTVPYTAVALEPVRFDTLNIDTANWVDFDADPTTIRVDRGGIFVVVASAEIVTVVGTNTYSMTMQSIPLGTIRDEQQKAAAAQGQSAGFSLGALVTVTTPSTFGLYVNNNNLINVTLTRAALTVFWHADRSTP